jgi:hypothetical protein
MWRDSRALLRLTMASPSKNRLRAWESSHASLEMAWSTESPRCTVRVHVFATGSLGSVKRTANIQFLIFAVDAAGVLKDSTTGEIHWIYSRHLKIQYWLNSTLRLAGEECLVIETTLQRRLLITICCPCLVEDIYWECRDHNCLLFKISGFENIYQPRCLTYC